MHDPESNDFNPKNCRVNDVILAKKATIERCIAQVRRFDSSASELPFEDDYLRQDAIAMNLQRACEASIDIANHIVRLRHLGLPSESKESFELLQKARLISASLSASLKSMVEFRNILVHSYQKLDLSVLRDVVDHRLDDLLAFVDAATSLDLSPE